jgi:predicted nucleic acid-binding protein
MSADVAYLDSSAFVKLIVQEPETEALQNYLQKWPRHTSSALLYAETIRAVWRLGSASIQLARARLDQLSLITIDRDILSTAAMAQPSTLRTLDAIHLASALAIGPDLGTLISYDQRLNLAATELGITIASPTGLG